MREQSIKIAKLFYQSREVEGYRELLLWIEKFTDFLDKMQGTEGKEEQTIGLYQLLQEILKAMEQGDIVLIADILKYDLQKLLQDLEE